MNHCDNRTAGVFSVPVLFVCLLSIGVAIEHAQCLKELTISVLIAAVATALLLLGRILVSVTFVVAALIMWLAVDAAIDSRLPASLDGRSVLLSGVITTVPSSDGVSLRFRFAPHKPTELPDTILLTWIDSPYEPMLGETWQIEARLRRPRGLANPGGFDYAGWSFREKIGATGIVVNNNTNRRLVHEAPAALASIRQRFNVRLQSLFPPGDARAVMLAIGSGTRHEITATAWQRYALTGTSHLVAVSGLHVGLAAGSAFVFAWLVLGAVLRTHSVRDIAIILAVATALLYALVTGFAVPARRAFMMFAMLALALLFRRRLCKWQVLSLVGVVVLLESPVSFFTPGFKMSFLAVAVIFLALAVIQIRPTRKFPGRMQGAWRNLCKLLRVQRDLLLGLFPLTVLLFDRVAFVAPAVNLLVLPVFNLVAAPFCLLGMFLDGALQPVGDVFLGIAYQGVRLALAIIAWFAEFSSLSILTPELSMILKFAVWLPLLKVVLPPGWPGSRVAYVAMAAVTTYVPPAPAAGCLAVTVLDVGQGLAVVLRSPNQTLLYDTGPAYRGGGSAAEYVVLPYLRAQGIDRIDRLIVSHGDNDHAGGVASILRSMETGSIVAGEAPQNPGVYTRPCRAMETWDVDGVAYRFLHPRNPGAWQGNNLSCVLLIEIGEHELLLTGDIERPAELLLAYLGVLPDVEIVVVPHHGSATSSSAALVAALRADFAVVSAAYGNRWGLPKPDVVARWQHAGSRVINTADSGAISFQYCAGETIGTPVLERQIRRRIWHAD